MSEALLRQLGPTWETGPLLMQETPRSSSVSSEARHACLEAHIARWQHWGIQLGLRAGPRLLLMLGEAPGRGIVQCRVASCPALGPWKA